MELLNAVITIIWIILAIRCAVIFDRLHKAHTDQQYIVFALTILLLAGLNICIGLYSILSDVPHSTCSFIQKFYFGTSLFQLLLSYCVLERIKATITPKK